MVILANNYPGGFFDNKFFLEILFVPDSENIAAEPPVIIGFDMYYFNFIAAENRQNTLIVQDYRCFVVNALKVYRFPATHTPRSADL